MKSFFNFKSAAFVFIFAMTTYADQTSRILPRSEALQSLTGAPPVLKPVPAEEDLASLVSVNDCRGILEKVAGHDYQKLPPRILAVVASCGPPGKDPEKMFLFAEKREPKSEVILLLHARYRQKKLAVNADELWLKLRNQTKDEKIKKIAESALQGYVDKNTNPLELRPSSLYLTASGSGIYETNPLALSNSDPNITRSGSSGVSTTAGARAALDSEVGTVNIDYIASATDYFSTPSVNLFTNDLDVPVIFQSTRTLSFGIRPFGSYYFLGGTQFYDRAGMSFMQIYDGNAFSHLFQFQIYQDGYFLSSLSALGGTHYRIEYKMRFLEEKILNTQVLLLVDHVTASQDASPNQLIYYSHTDSGVVLNFTHSFSRVTLGLMPQLYVRDDDQDSHYLDTVSGNPTSKRRQDFQTVVRAYVLTPLSRTFDLVAYYEFNSIRSNMGTSDYLDRNSLDQTFGLQMRWGQNNSY